jgi:hypothetical protein
MKNWETKEFTDEFNYAMDCLGCPAHFTCKITACEMMAQKKDCVRIFFEYAMQEHKLAVKKMTMQEWANVTGMITAKDKNGQVYLYPSGEIEKVDNIWKSASDNASYANITDRVTDAEGHDWNIPCYPEGDENE